MYSLLYINKPGQMLRAGHISEQGSHSHGNAWKKILSWKMGQKIKSWKFSDSDTGKLENMRKPEGVCLEKPNKLKRRYNIIYIIIMESKERNLEADNRAMVKIDIQ